MRTPEQWMSEYQGGTSESVRKLKYSVGDLFRAVQMEAFKAGMTRAIERLYNERIAGATIMADALVKDRDNLKPEDMK